MKMLVVIAAMSVSMMVAANAQAQEALAKSSGCMNCHAVDTKKVGPAFKDVAAKYKGNAKAQAMLEEKVKKGGVGVWGQVPMPPNSAVKDEDIKKLVAWVLSLK